MKNYYVYIRDAEHNYSKDIKAYYVSVDPKGNLLFENKEGLLIEAFNKKDWISFKEIINE